MPRKTWIGQNPRLFFEEYVVPSIEEWRNEPLVVRKAVIAICQLDALAEHVLCALVTRGDPKDHPAKFRNRMAAREPLLKVARDVHDTHKHGGLERDDALIKSGKPPRLAWVGGAFQPNVFDNRVFQVGDPELQVHLDDGTVETVCDVIEKTFSFWRQELDALKL